MLWFIAQNLNPMQLWSISLNKLISICSLHEKIFEPLAHRQIAHCIVYKSTFTSLTKILEALGIRLVSFRDDCICTLYMDWNQLGDEPDTTYP